MLTRTSANNKKLSIVIILLLVFGMVEYFFYIQNDKTNILPEDVNVTSGWEIKNDSVKGVSFKYPLKLPTSYIFATEWPPEVNIYPEPLVCTEAGFETARTGITEKRQIGGREFCVTKTSEGAAGSIYTSYAYGTGIKGKIAIYSFTIKSVQCANYDDFQKVDCEKERTNFNMDKIVDQMVRTTKIN